MKTLCILDTQILLYQLESCGGTRAGSWSREWPVTHWPIWTVKQSLLHTCTQTIKYKVMYICITAQLRMIHPTTEQSVWAEWDRKSNKRKRGLKKIRWNGIGSLAEREQSGSRAWAGAKEVGVSGERGNFHRSRSAPAPFRCSAIEYAILYVEIYVIRIQKPVCL